MVKGMDRDDLAMIAEGLERILSDAPLEAIDDAGGCGEDADALWAVLSENGYPLLCASEENGGFGASIADAATLARLAGRHALAVPLSDTALAIGLLSASGAKMPTGRVAIADPLDPAAHLAHAYQSDAVLMLADGNLRLSHLDPANRVPINNGEDGAGRFVSSPGPLIDETPAPNWLTPEVLHAFAALMRSASMAGAMQAVLDLTLGYTQEREQFGRPLAKFQAIQHHLSDIACETAAASAAVELASDALAADPACGLDVIDEIAIAKIRCGEAAARVATAAHQAHGAMGFTREYRLGRYTRRLWQWQDEFGSESNWAIRLGRGVLSEAEPALWPRISKAV